MNSDETAFPWGDREDDLAAKIDTTAPVSARVWNYLMGGENYYPVDKEAGDQFAAVFPGIFDVARASRYFIARTVRFLAGTGIRQFLDIGTGMPGHDNTHEIAQQATPDARVVYVDNDPLVLAHARALLTGSTQDGSTAYIDGDLNHPQAILDAAAAELDFGQPVAIMLMNVLGHIGNPYEDHEDQTARSVVHTLKAALPSGGYLAIQDGVTTSPEAVQGEDQYNQTGAAPYRLRSIEQLGRLFDGLDLIDPGFTEVGRWRPDPSPFEPPAVPQWGGIARKR